MKSKWRFQYFFLLVPVFQEIKFVTIDCSATETQRHDIEMVGIPDYMDWRQKGGVSPVKNQGHCGSCWTFSTTGCLESAHAIHHGNFFNLSEQQLVDCAQERVSKLCTKRRKSKTLINLYSIVI